MAFMVALLYRLASDDAPPGISISMTTEGGCDI